MECSFPDWWLPICIALATGVRRGELLMLEYQDLDLVNGTLHMSRGKTAAARRKIPLAGEVLGLLRGWSAEQQLRARDLVLLGLKRSRLQRAWTAIRQEAKVRDAWWHDLRHTWAVYCTKNGMPLTELQYYGGWAHLEKVQRYAHYVPDARSQHLTDAAHTMGLASVDVAKTTTAALKWAER